MQEITFAQWGETTSTGTVIVDVWKDDCPYCVQYAPIFEAAEAENTDTTFLKFNLAIKDVTPQWISTYFGNGKLDAPATLLLQDGKLINRKFGFMTAEQLASFLRLRTLNALYLEKGKLITAINIAHQVMRGIEAKDQTKLTDEDYLARGKAATDMEVAQATIAQKLNPQIDNLLALGVE
jgi:thiol-disulfide isomerase/thioredoxin